jgi:hypothetical protein
MEGQTHPPGHRHARVELLATERLESLNTKLQTSLDQLDVGSLSQCVVNNTLVLINRDGTCRVDDVSTCLGSGVTGVEGTEEKLLLQVSEELEVTLGLKFNGQGKLAGD